MTWIPRDSLCVFIWLTLLVAGVPGFIQDGQKYIIACPKPQSSTSVKCTLHVQGSEGTGVTINGSGSGYPRTETVTDALAISIVIQETSSSAVILTVTATDVVSIFVQNEANGLITSSYLALALGEDLSAPYTGASVENVLLSFSLSSPEQNFHIVGSAYAATTVTIALNSTGPVVVQGVTYSSGDTISVSVDALQGIEITTVEDLSGSLLTSDKPVGVFSGIVGETLGQIPPMSKWGMPNPVPNMDICNSFLMLAVVPSPGSLQINENDFLLNAPLLKAGSYQHVPNKTSIAQGISALVSLQCRIGVSNKPLFLTLATFSQLGTEFKCFTYSGFVNTMYIIAFKDDPIYSYDINGETFNFTLIDTYRASTISTYRSSVPDGFLVIKTYDSFPFLPYVVGVTADGSRTYAQPCALGSLGSLLPEPTTSLSGDVTTTLDPGSESVFMTSSGTETSSDVILNSSIDITPITTPTSSDVILSSSIDVTLSTALTSSDVILSSSIDVTPSTTFQDSSSLSQIMEYSTSLDSGLMDLVSSSGMSSDVVSSSTPVTSDSAATADTSFVSTAQVADSTTSLSLSTTAGPSTDTSLLTSSSPLSTSSSNAAVTSPVDFSSSTIAVTSSAVDSTSNSAIDSAISTSTINNAVTSSVVSASPSGTTMTSSVSATPVQTTELATVTGDTTEGLQEVCLCRCGEMVILPNETKQFLAQYDIEIKINLTLDAKTLSAYIRAKTSAEDDRPSAQNFGYFGICLLTVTFGILILSDVLNLYIIFKSKKK